MKSILLFTTLFSMLAAAGQTWVCVKAFKPYYFPGDYEVWQMKSAETRTNVVHDTIYIDSCRLRAEALAKEAFKKDTIVRPGVEHTGTVFFFDTATRTDNYKSQYSAENFYRDTGSLTRSVLRLSVDSTGTVMHVKNGTKTKWRTKYKTKYRNLRSYRVYYAKPAPKPKPMKKVKSLPTEIMIKQTILRNGSVVKIRYRKIYTMKFDKLFTFMFPHSKDVVADSVSFQIYIPSKPIE